MSALIFPTTNGALCGAPVYFLTSFHAHLSVTAYLDALTDPTQRSDAKELVQLMQRPSGAKPRLWGPSIVGFGTCHYKYDSGREGDMPLISFSARKAALVLYSLLANEKTSALLVALVLFSGILNLHLMRGAEIVAFGALMFQMLTPQ